MRQSICVFGFLTLLTCLSGCGGGGSSTPSPFFGLFSASYDSVSLNDHGEMFVQIDQTGKITGSANDSRSSEGALSGTISRSGELVATVSFPGAPIRTFRGTLVNGIDGTVSGPVTEELSQVRGTSVMVLRAMLGG